MMGIVNAEVLAYSELISERDFPGISPRPCIRLLSFSPLKTLNWDAFNFSSAK